MNKIVLFFSLISVFNVFYAAERSAIKDEALNALLGKLAQGSSSDDENEPDASFISLEEAKKMVSQKYPKVLFCEEFFSSPDFSDSETSVERGAPRFVKPSLKSGSFSAFKM